MTFLPSLVFGTKNVRRTKGLFLSSVLDPKCPVQEKCLGGTLPLSGPHTTLTWKVGYLTLCWTGG